MTKGCGHVFTINGVDADNNPLAFPAAVSAFVDIDPTNPTEVDAVVNDATSVTVTLEAAVCDLVKPSTAWRVVLETDPPTPIVVGVFERHDGRT